MKGVAELTGTLEAPTSVTVVADGSCTGMFNNGAVILTPVKLAATAEPEAVVSGIPATLTPQGHGTITFPELGETLHVILHHFGPVLGVDEGRDGGVFIGLELPLPPADPNCELLFPPASDPSTCVATRTESGYEVPLLIVAQTVLPVAGSQTSS